MSEPTLQDLFDRLDLLAHDVGNARQGLVALEAQIGTVRAEIAQLRSDGGDRLRETEQRINARLDRLRRV